MKKYLAMFLCFSFLLANPVEAAVNLNQNQNDGGQTESYLALALGTKARANAKEANLREAQNVKKTGTKDVPNAKEKAGLQKESNAKTAKNRANEKDAGHYSPGDLELLARLVHAEARGEPYQGKVAVAATVLNRVDNPDYPATIAAVVYEYNQGYQYCPVRNGTINCTASKEARQAVEEALAGEDPTGGAVSFFNPSQSSNTWIRQRPYATTIGNHVFVK